LSPIRDPDDPATRRLTRLATRMGRREPEKPGEGGSKRSEARRSGRRAPRQPVPGEIGLEEDWEALPKRERHGQRRSEAVSRRASRLRLETEEELPPSASTRLAEGATIVAVTRGQCEIELASGELAVAHLPKALTLAQRSEIAVGDRVVLERRPSGELAVAALAPRRNRLSRPDPHHAHRERILAANLDVAVVVASFRRPPLTPGLIDRFLVALAHGGVPALVAVNKLDLVEEPRGEDEEIRALAPYRDLGLPLVLCSTQTGEGLEELGRELTGRTAVFVGHSGVGKSSLLNALAPEVAADVGEVSDAHRRGRHTTVRARVYRLTGGTRIVDTPGIREFGLWRMSPGELAGYFDDFRPHADRCRFANCTHSHEPRCGVRRAAEEGTLSTARYEAYLRILSSLGSG